MESSRLLAYAELADDFAIAVGVVRLEVVKQAAALAHQHQQAAARTMVFRVGLEVLGQLANALAEDRDLHFRTAGVGVMRAKTRDNVGLFCRCQHGRCVTPVSCSLHFLSVCIKNNMVHLEAATESTCQYPSFPLGRTASHGSCSLSSLPAPPPVPAEQARCQAGCRSGVSHRESPCAVTRTRPPQECNTFPLS